MTVHVELAIEAPGWKAVAALEALVQRAVDGAACGAGVILAKEAEVSLLLCDDQTMRDLNRDWRGLDQPTNVLSFPVPTPLPLHEKPLLGDIAVAFETVHREAQESAKTLSDHLTHLVVHGFLHLLGHDHGTETEGAAMEGLEIRILADLGISDPYADTNPVEASEL